MSGLLRRMMHDGEVVTYKDHPYCIAEIDGKPIQEALRGVHRLERCGSTVQASRYAWPRRRLAKGESDPEPVTFDTERVTISTDKP